MRKFAGGAFAILAMVAMLSLASVSHADNAESTYTHDEAWPEFFMDDGPDSIEAIARGAQYEHDRSAHWLLEQQRLLTAQLDAVQPGEPGIVDAFVISVSLDSDAVFTREARAAADVLQRRFDAAGRTILLGGSDRQSDADVPHGSPFALAMALARVAEVKQPEDVLILYTTSHGSKQGVAYHDGDEGFGFLSPARLAALFAELGLERRLVMISACYSGVFVEPLRGDDSALITAASSKRPSFGCYADNDWTFFGDALINRALRKPQPLRQAAAEAQEMIASWEEAIDVNPSQPQVDIGKSVALWLEPLEARMPNDATEPVGRPATAGLFDE